MTDKRLTDLVTVTPIKAFTDNYIWCLDNGNDAVVVDPGDAEPVLAYLKSQHLNLAAILITHHHKDHTGGLARLTSEFSEIPVIGPRGSHIRGITKSVTQGDTVHLPVIDCHFTVIETPGHTLDHIAFYGHGALFCGDTLFAAGCGRLFEGSPEQMLHSLNKLKRLPADTKIYCTHEYTLANIKFARAVEPDNDALSDYARWAESVREEGEPTLPSDMETQLAVNPFLRCKAPAVVQAANKRSQYSLEGEVAVFATIRQWKDEF